MGFYSLRRELRKRPAASYAAPPALYAARLPHSARYLLQISRKQWQPRCI